MQQRSLAFGYAGLGGPRFRGYGEEVVSHPKTLGEPPKAFSDVVGKINCVVSTQYVLGIFPPILGVSLSNLMSIFSK